MSTLVNEEGKAESVNNSTSKNIADSQWLKACHVDDLVINSGVCVLLNEQAIALYAQTNYVGKDADATLNVFALSNIDPVTQASVLSRGLLGSTGDTLFVASPIYKERYNLETGECIDNDDLSVQSYPTKIVDAFVYIAVV